MTSRAPFEPTSRSRSEPTIKEVSSTVAVLAVFACAPAALVVGAQVTHALNVASFWAILGFGLLVLVGTGSVGLRSWRFVRVAKPTGAEGWWWAAMAVLITATFGVVFVWSWRVPSSRGVDLAHHAAITAWIREHQAFPTTRVPQLDEYSTYPNGAHIVAATLMWVFRWPALSATWVVGLGAVFSSWLFEAAIVARLVGRRWVVSLVVPVVSLMSWRYTIGMMSWDQFFSQVVGLAFLIAAVMVAVVGVESIAVRAWLPPVLLLSAAGILCFPSQAALAPMMLFGVAFAHVLQPNGDRWRPSRRTLGLLIVSAVTLAGAAVVIGRRIDFSRRTLAGHGEGEVAHLTLRTSGGVVVVILAAVGALVALRSTRRGDEGSGAMLGAVLAPALTALAFISLRHGFPTRIPIYNYRIAKNAYTAAPFVVVLASLGATCCLGRPRPNFKPVEGRELLFGFGAVAVALSLLTQPTYRSNAHNPILTPRQLAFAERVGHRYPPEQVAIVGRDLVPFHVWWTSIRRRVDPSTGMVPMADRTTRWEAWPLGSTERYLLAIGEPYVTAIAARAGVSIVERRGDAVLFERLRGGY